MYFPRSSQHNGHQKTVVVYGPQGCGKSTNARSLADALQLNNIIDDWHPGMGIPSTDHLLLTNHDGPFDRAHSRALSFSEAIKQVKHTH